MLEETISFLAATNHRWPLAEGRGGAAALRGPRRSQTSYRLYSARGSRWTRESMRNVEPPGRSRRQVATAEHIASFSARDRSQLTHRIRRRTCVQQRPPVALVYCCNARNSDDLCNCTAAIVPYHAVRSLFSRNFTTVRSLMHN